MFYSLLFILLLQPGPSVPPKSPRNVEASAEHSASEPLKSRSPVSPPRSVSPKTPRSESPIFQKNIQQAAKVNRSSSPNLVLVTERDAFGLKQSPIFNRRLLEGTSQEVNFKSDILSGNVGKTEKVVTSKERTQDQDTETAVKILSESADISKNQQKPPPPKPKVKPKMGQSSAMLLKNATEQNKPDIAKEEEKRVGKAIPNWLEELQKKKVKLTGESSKGPRIKPKQISSEASTNMPLAKEPSTMVESSTDELPAWMKSEFLKLKQGTDTAESEEPNLKSDLGQRKGIDHLLKKSKENEPSKPSWLDELNKRKKNQALVSDNIVKGSDQFDYRSHEEIKQKSKESTSDEQDEADGVMKSISDIKAKLNKKIVENEQENVMKKPTLLKHINDDVTVRERNDSHESKEIDHPLGKGVTPESSGKTEDMVGENERSVSHLEYRDGDSESRSGLVEKRDILNRVESNSNVNPHSSYNDAKDSSLESTVSKMVVKGGYSDMGGSKDGITSNNYENKKELVMEKSTDRGIRFESSYSGSSINKSGGLEYTQQNDIGSSQNISESAMEVNANDKEYVQSHNQEKKVNRNISSDLNSDRSQTSESSRVDAEKLDFFKEEIPIKRETMQINDSQSVKKDVVLEFQQMEEDDGKKEGLYSSEVTKRGLKEPDKEEYKLSMAPKKIEKLETDGVPEAIEKSSTLSSNETIDSSSVHTYSELHLDNEMSKMEEKDDARKSFPKPLRRKLVRISSFEQGALSKPTCSDVGQKNTSSEIAKNEESQIKQESTASVEKTEAVRNQVQFDDQKSEDKEILITGASNTRNKNDSGNVETGKEVKIDDINTDIAFKTGIGGNYDKSSTINENGNSKKDVSSQDLGRDTSLIKTEACQGDDIVLDTTKDSVEYEKGDHRMAIFDTSKENSLDKKDMQREAPKISKAISHVERETSAKEKKELSDGVNSNVGINKDTNKGIGIDVNKDISILEKERKPPPPPSKKKPPAPKPKPKPKPKVPLKNVTEVKHSEEKKDDIRKDTFAKVDAKESKVEPKLTEVIQIENLKNIEKSKNIKEVGSEKDEKPNEKPHEQNAKAVETETEKKVEMRRKDENRTRQQRPVSMFENFSTVDSNVPARDRKFSGVSSGTKFAVELEKKQKSCWFRGALDTNDIRAFESYDGDDDIPAWKRQLLAKLKSNEKSTGNYF